MARFKSAFAVPSGFAVSSRGVASKATKPSEAGVTKAKAQATAKRSRSQPAATTERAA